MKNVKTGHDAPIVTLDAGHYGKYNRSPAVGDYYESDMVWKLHLSLREELEKYGITVRLTRAEQAKDMGLSARGKASEGSDLFLSIHSNAVGNGVNESVDYPLAIVQLDGKGNELGTALAKTIQETMGTTQAGRITTRKGNGGEYYGVLRGAAAVGTMGMILEHSFHTNTRATNWLLNDANLQALAQAEAKTIAAWFGLEETSDTTTKTQDKPEQKTEEVTVDYAAIDHLELRQGNVPGTRVGGWGSARLLLGFFRNEELGNYTRYTYVSPDACIVLTAGEKALVLSGKNAPETEQIYNALLQKLEK